MFGSHLNSLGFGTSGSLHSVRALVGGGLLFKYSTFPRVPHFALCLQDSFHVSLFCSLCVVRILILLGCLSKQDLPKPSSSQGRLSSLLDFMSCHIKAFLRGLYGEEVLMLGTPFLNVVFVHAEASWCLYEVL